MRGLAPLLAIVLAGCVAATDGATVTGLGYPHDGVLSQHGVRLRCGHVGGECRAEALGIAEEVMATLGAPYRGARVRAGVPAVEVYVDRDPAWQWSATDASGRTDRILFDLTAVLTEVGQPFAVIGGGDGPAYTVPADAASRLVDALFVGLEG